MNSRRRGSPPQCAGNLARKNSLSIIVNTFAKLLLNPLFSHNLGILAQVITIGGSDRGSKVCINN